MDSWSQNDNKNEKFDPWSSSGYVLARIAVVVRPGCAFIELCFVGKVCILLAPLIPKGDRIHKQFFEASSVLWQGSFFDLFKLNYLKDTILALYGICGFNLGKVCCGKKKSLWKLYISIERVMDEFQVGTGKLVTVKACIIQMLHRSQSPIFNLNFTPDEYVCVHKRNVVMGFFKLTSHSPH
jgi:hypothetical protein